MYADMSLYYLLPYIMVFYDCFMCQCSTADIKCCNFRSKSDLACKMRLDRHIASNIVYAKQCSLSDYTVKYPIHNKKRRQKHLRNKKKIGIVFSVANCINLLFLVCIYLKVYVFIQDTQWIYYFALFIFNHFLFKESFFKTFLYEKKCFSCPYLCMFSLSSQFFVINFNNKSATRYRHNSKSTFPIFQPKQSNPSVKKIMIHNCFSCSVPLASVKKSE